jgi:protein SCO1/2
MIKYLFAGLALAFVACQQPKPLPILGEPGPDGSPHQVKQDFSLVNQNGQTITGETVKGKVYVADFFFTHCPTICPKVKKEMKRIFDHYKGNPNFVMLSHSIDAKRDTVGRLAFYAQKLGIEAPTWHLLHGEYEIMEGLAGRYLLAAKADETAPGGFDHSGAFALVDQKGHIRGLYDGRDPEKVQQAIGDIQRLLDEGGK